MAKGARRIVAEIVEEDGVPKLKVTIPLSYFTVHGMQYGEGVPLDFWMDVMERLAK